MAAKQLLFEKEGGDPALDFVNTLDERLSGSPVERLPDYRALLAFAQEYGFINQSEARNLAAVTSARDAAGIAARVIRLRESLYHVVAMSNVSQRVIADSIAVIRREIRTAQQAADLEFVGGAFSWNWREPACSDRPIWEIAASVGQFLVSPRYARVRKCAAADCGTYYIDDGPRGRRWCRMSNCGNREKVRRFRRLRSKRRLSK